MKKKSIKSVKKNLAIGLHLFMAISFSYFVWLTWSKLTDIIGNGIYVWLITGGVVLLGLLTGTFSLNQLIKRFT